MAEPDLRHVSARRRPEQAGGFELPLKLTPQAQKKGLAKCFKHCTRPNGRWLTGQDREKRRMEGGFLRPGRQENDKDGQSSVKKQAGLHHLRGGTAQFSSGGGL